MMNVILGVVALMSIRLRVVCPTAPASGRPDFVSFVQRPLDSRRWGLSAANGSWFQPFPVQLELVHRNGTVSWVHLPYSELGRVVEDSAGGATSNLVVAARTVYVTQAGSIVTVVDVLSQPLAAFASNFTLERTVEVVALDPTETIVAFSSRFEMVARSMREQYDFFMPAVRYVHPPFVQAGAHSIFWKNLRWIFDFSIP